MKKLEEIAFIVQARLNSARLPNKVIKEFADGKSLFELALEKLCNIDTINPKQIYASVGEDKLINIAKKYPSNIYKRSENSFLYEDKLTGIFEWHNKLPSKFKYYFIINTCSPLLTEQTILSFLDHYLNSPHKGLFAVLEKNTLGWDCNLDMINQQNNLSTLNTKQANTIYLPAHLLYAGEISKIKDNIHMGTFNKKNDPELYIIKDEIECWDIDYEWQFKLAQQLYKNRKDYEKNNILHP